MIDSDELKKDLPPEADSAAPHEIMSAIIGIKEFGNMLEDEESRELFARCITGYKLSNPGSVSLLSGLRKPQIRF